MKMLSEYPVDINAGKNEPTSTEERIGFFPDGKRFWTVNGTKVHFWDISDLTSSVKDPTLY